MPTPAMRSASSLLMRNSASLLSGNNATALLIPLRGISTSGDRVPGSGGGDGPPPGFKLNEAKKPLKKDDSEVKTAKPKAHESKEPAKAEVKQEAASEAKSATPVAATKENGMVKKEDAKEEKLSLGQRIKKEILHYWDGTKLLATEVKISSRLALKMAAGYELTRREHRQLRRTVQDIARLVPFSIFVIVPFAELLLPVALRLFPNLLPSTYEGQKSKDKKAQALRSTRKEVSTFLRSTLKETGLPLTPATAQKEEFANFFRKVRSTGEKPTREDVIKVCQIFKDDVTLDNLSRPQLVSMCRYLGMNTYGTDAMLRYQIRVRMRQIKEDDRAISYEGVDSLTVAELQSACQNRGIRSYGVSPARLREDLQTWLNLRLKEGVPSTLLVLSNAYMYSQAQDTEMSTQIDALIGVLSSIPEELFHEIELEVHTAEGAATNKQRLEVLKEQEELIDEELEQNEENSKSGVASPSDTEDIDAAEDRQAEAEPSTVDTAQVSEAVDAEKESLAASKVAAELEKGNEEAVERFSERAAEELSAAATTSSKGTNEGSK
jgi:LETM1 and EF-hand domain-containing protein 1, mitochondrial